MSQPERKYLFLRSIYGVNKSVKGNVCFIPIPKNNNEENSDQTLISSVCGNTLVLHNPNNRRDFFIQPGEDSQSITAMKLSPDKRFFMIACRGRVKEEDGKIPPPFIKIYEVTNYKEVKRIDAPKEFGSRDIISIDRSKDNKILVMQGGPPHYRIGAVIFHDMTRIKKTIIVEKVVDIQKISQLIGNAITPMGNTQSPLFKSGMKFEGIPQIGGENPLPIYHSSMNGKNLLCVTGTDLFKIYRVDEVRVTCVRTDHYKDFPATEQANQIFVTHLWLNEHRLLLCNSIGSLYIIEDNEYKCMLNSSPSNDLAINCALPYEKAFIIGQEDGQLIVYERSDFESVHEGMYKKQKTIKLPNENDFLSPEDLTVLNMDYDESNSNLIVLTRSSQVFSLMMTGSSLKSMGEGDIEKIGVFHTKEINGMDMALKKPYIVTCGNDRSVRILNYHTREMELFKVYQMEAHSVAIHPSGYYLVVGFTDKVRFFKILGDNLKEETSFPIRGCSEIRFSNGGQYFAAAHGTSIHIYCSNTYEHLYALRNAHTSKVTCVFWSEDDTHITSVDSSGTVVEFQLKNETKVWDHSLNDVQMHSVISNPKSTFVVGSDSKIHVFVEQVPLSEYKVEKSYSALSLCSSNKLLMAGRVDGATIVYGQNNLSQIKDAAYIHSDMVRRICVTYRGDILVSISRDGSMAIFDIIEKDRVDLPTNTALTSPTHIAKRIVDVSSLLTSDGGLGSNQRFTESKSLVGSSVDEIWDDEILIDKIDLTAKINLINTYEMKCQDLKSESEYNQIKKQLEYDNRVKKQAEDYNREIKVRMEKIKELELEIKEKSKKHELEKKERSDLHRKETSELEGRCNESVTAILKKKDEYENEKTKELKLLTDKAEEEEFYNEEEKTRVKEQYEDEIKNLNSGIRELDTDKNQMRIDHDQLLKEIKKKNNEKLDRAEDEYVRKLKNAEKRFKELSEKNVKKEEKESKNQKKEQRLRKQIDLKVKELRDREEKFIQKEREANSMMNENKEREETIREKDRRISQLNRQNKELKKFKFVLNYKIETLQNEINPNRETINQLTSELSRYEEELNQYKVKKKELDTEIKELEGKIKGNEIELVKLSRSMREMESYRTRITSDIHEICVTKKGLDEPRMLKSLMVQFYHRHSAPFSKKFRLMDMDVQKEIDRKRTHLEKTVESLKKKLRKAQKSSNKETHRIMHENVMLIKELNNLQKEVIYLNRKYHLRSKLRKGSRKRSSEVTNIRSRFPQLTDQIRSEDDGISKKTSLNTQLEIMKDKREMQILQIEALKKQKENLFIENRSNSRGSSRGSSRSGRRSGGSSRSGRKRFIKDN